MNAKTFMEHFLISEEPSSGPEEDRAMQLMDEACVAMSRVPKSKQYEASVRFGRRMVDGLRKYCDGGEN